MDCIDEDSLILQCHKICKSQIESLRLLYTSVTFIFTKTSDKFTRS